MVSFCCDNCNETLKKAKVKQHNSYCRGPFTCLDCNVTMGPGQYEAHTSCISEAQRYEKTVWKGDKVKGKGKNKQNGQQQQQNGQQQQGTSKAAATPSESKPAPMPSAEAPSASAAPQEASTTGDSSTVSKKSKKDKKRKRSDEDGAAGTSGEFLSPSVKPSTAEKQGQSGGALQETEKQAADVHPTKGHANGIDQAEEVKKADEAHEKEKKKRRKGKKDDGEGEDAETAEAKALGKPVPASSKKQTKAEIKERMLNTYNTSVENGAEVTLKYLLEQAEAAGADKESIIGGLKVTSVKKGKFVVSFD